jgi:hypothetical protein
MIDWFMTNEFMYARAYLQRQRVCPDGACVDERHPRAAAAAAAAAAALQPAATPPPPPPWQDLRLKSY